MRGVKKIKMVISFYPVGLYGFSMRTYWILLITIAIIAVGFTGCTTSASHKFNTGDVVKPYDFTRNDLGYMVKGIDEKGNYLFDPATNVSGTWKSIGDVKVWSIKDVDGGNGYIKIGTF
jgi:hypothetical protein